MNINELHLLRNEIIQEYITAQKEKDAVQEEEKLKALADIEMKIIDMLTPNLNPKQKRFNNLLEVQQDEAYSQRLKLWDELTKGRDHVDLRE
jgi:hypothetical protein